MLLCREIRSFGVIDRELTAICDYFDNGRICLTFDQVFAKTILLRIKMHGDNLMQNFISNNCLLVYFSCPTHHFGEKREKLKKMPFRGAKPPQKGGAQSGSTSGIKP